MIQCHDKEKYCIRQQTMWKESGVAENIEERRALFSGSGKCDSVGTTIKREIIKIKYCHLV
jgi:hypothetical protein